MREPELFICRKIDELPAVFIRRLYQRRGRRPRENDAPASGAGVARGDLADADMSDGQNDGVGRRGFCAVSRRRHLEPARGEPLREADLTRVVPDNSDRRTGGLFLIIHFR